MAGGRGPVLDPGCVAPWPSIDGRCNSIVNRVLRSTRVPIAESRSPSTQGSDQRGEGLLPVRFPGPPSAPDVRLSSHPALHGLPLLGRNWSFCAADPRRGDVVRAPAVSSDRDRSGVEHSDPFCCRTIAWPSGQEAPYALTSAVTTPPWRIIGRESGHADRDPVGSAATRRCAPWCRPSWSWSGAPSRSQRGSVGNIPSGACGT
jgi:hypothetical protein